MNLSVLFVDDEPNILMAFRRQLRTQYAIETANSGREALHLLTSGETFAVIISDLRMPGMDGIQFLSQAKALQPDSARILLTGHADLTTAIDAINNGNIFRFLTKPCTLELLTETINAGLEQYRLITAERELLEKTLGKTVKLMSDMLILSNPVAYGRAIRIRHIVQEIAKAMNLAGSWQFELAAMLSQIGCVALPKDLLVKLEQGQPLNKKEESMYASHPLVGYKLLQDIPRLESIAQMVRDQQRTYSSYAEQRYSYQTHDIELGAQLLKVALDYDQAAQSGCSQTEIIADMLRKTVVYNTDLIEALSSKEFADDPWESKLSNFISSAGKELKPGFPEEEDEKKPLAEGAPQPP